MCIKPFGQSIKLSSEGDRACGPVVAFRKPSIKLLLNQQSGPFNADGLAPGGLLVLGLRGPPGRLSGSRGRGTGGLSGVMLSGVRGGRHRGALGAGALGRGLVWALVMHRLPTCEFL